ncbi:cyclodeaminase/cyclohydrolase family protein [Salinirubellus sp. GCM10025818]|uniref:cyclodeaminase/cyclohydrolase family protein n=1 Tax=Salinirubellus TaxID=2162630 RepID=UPI0030D08445
MSYADRTIDEFLDSVASRNVTPAGGTAAALVGAIGTALCEMVCLHTIGKDGYADVEAEMNDVLDDLGTQRELLLELAERDADVVDELLATSPDEPDRVVAQKRATGVPLAIAEACVPVLEHATVLAKEGNRNAVPDAGTGSFLVHGALRASVFTVRCNLDRISDPSFVEEMETRATELERSAEIEFGRVISTIERDG